MNCDDRQSPEIAPPGASEPAEPLSLPEHADAGEPSPSHPAALSRANLLRLAVAFEGGLGLAALLLARWLHLPSPASQIQWALPGLAWGAGAGTLMALLLLLGLRAQLPWLCKMRRVLDETLSPALRRCHLLDVALIAALAGIGEELFFRCVVQGGIATAIGGAVGPWVGLTVAAVTFGLVHPLSQGYIVLAGVFGLTLGLLWMATGNLLVPIVAHGWYDFLALLYLARRPQANQPPG